MIDCLLRKLKKVVQDFSPYYFYTFLRLKFRDVFSNDFNTFRQRRFFKVLFSDDFWSILRLISCCEVSKISFLSEIERGYSAKRFESARIFCSNETF